MRVPDEVSIIVVDNISLGRYIDPLLTTIALNQIKMGELAIGLLIQRIESKPCESVLLNTAGIIRPRFGQRAAAREGMIAQGGTLSSLG